MTDPNHAFADRLAALQDQLENAALAADLTLGFHTEARDLASLADRVEETIRSIANEEARPIVSIDPGGVVRTDDGFRCWGTLALGGIGERA
jgi:hypothetical protein